MSQKNFSWILGGAVVIIGLCVFTVFGLAFLLKPALTTTATNWITGQQQSAAPAAPSAAVSGDPLYPSLKALGFSSREELIQFFSMEDVSPAELHVCPDENACIAIKREKNANGVIIPFKMTNPTNFTFDGWRAEGQQGGQAKVPPGTWSVEGVTIRPWK